MPSDTEVQQLVIYVGTQAKIEEAREAGTIGPDDFVVVTDAPALQPLLTAQNAGTGIAITTEGGIVKISNTQTSAIWGNILGNLPDQYDLNQALEGKQPVILDLSTIRDGAALGATALQVSDIINAVNSTATNKALSANMGKSLQDQIDNLKSRGRFLSVWNSSTGLPTTNPEESPYNYRAGDYYIVGTVASGGTNYRPNGSSYVIGVASTTVESGEVNRGDTYIYDGSEWLLQSDTQKTLAFANIAGDPYDNTNLASALNAKQNELTQGTGITITGTTISNAGVRSISSGATNGTISVNTGGSSAEVSVHGLGTAAFTSTTDYATAAQGTKADSAVQDVQVNGTTVTTSGVANIGKAGDSSYGVVKTNSTTYGIGANADGILFLRAATNAQIDAKTTSFFPIMPSTLDYAVKVGLTTNTNTLTTSEQETACSWLGASQVEFVDWE